MAVFASLSLRRLAHSICRIASIHEKSQGDVVTIKGWIKNVRKMKKNLFLDVNDGSCCKHLQVVTEKDTKLKLGVGDTIHVIGIVGQSPQGHVELVAKELTYLSPGNVTDGYPFTPRQSHAPEYIREYLHLRPKVDRFSSLLRVRHWTTKFVHDYFTEKDFLQVHTPVLTSNDCEGAGEVFLVKPDNNDLLKTMAKENKSLDEAYFDKKVFLSVSGQLALEAVTQGMGNTYCLMPAFRAENSKSPLHMTEFHMLEAEMAYLSELVVLTDFIEDLIKTVTKQVFDKCDAELHNCTGDDTKSKFDIVQLLNRKWSTLSYDEAIKILSEHKSELKFELKYEDGLSKEQELFLVKHLNAPVFIENWPKSMKPFYMRPNKADPTKVDAIDLLMPGVGELIGGSLRENDYDRLQSALPPGLEWYLDLRKFGYIPTGGFGLGFERYLQLITGVHNIRDVIPFPRWPHSCDM